MKRLVFVALVAACGHGDRETREAVVAAPAPVARESPRPADASPPKAAEPVSQPATSVTSIQYMPPEVPMQLRDAYSLHAPALDGSDVDLSKYRGKVALVVNVASECGFTKQYAGLEKLWSEYKDKGLVVLGFPSNEFGGQEPGDAAAIRAFCTKNYGVTFPLFAKVHVKKGADQSPVYQYLTSAAQAEPNWNFCKYLVGKDGKVVKFWQSKTTPESAELRGAIDAALK